MITDIVFYCAKYSWVLGISIITSGILAIIAYLSWKKKPEGKFGFLSALLYTLFIITLIFQAIYTFAVSTVLIIGLIKNWWKPIIETPVVNNENSCASEKTIVIPSDTIEPIVVEKEAIKVAIEQLLIEWDKEIFTNSWNNNITDYYKDHYLEMLGSKDEIADLFSNQNRRIASDIVYDEWSENGTAVTVAMTINYGDNKPPDSCEYWFKLIKNTEDNSWLINADKTMATPGKANICPQ